MGLGGKAKAAREKADASIDPADHMLANALEGALAAEGRQLVADQTERDVEGIPTPQQSGYVGQINIEPPDTPSGR
jgi:hypothetical protein